MKHQKSIEKKKKIKMPKIEEDGGVAI